MNLRIAGIVRETITDGPGLRTTIFFQGCPHACPGCHNPQTWIMSGGREYEVGELVAALKIDPLLSGFTFSGGEPFSQAEAAAQLAERLISGRKNLWVYTGYTWEELQAQLDMPGFRPLLELTDVLVDGPYLKEARKLDLPFRGSENQRLILVRQSLLAGRPVEWQG